MAKKASKSKERSRKASKTRGTGKKAKASVRVLGSPAHEEDHIDGCDVEFPESEATADAALPAARGGVDVGRKRSRG
jgi:hypothetical protein